VSEYDQTWNEEGRWDDGDATSTSTEADEGMWRSGCAYGIDATGAGQHASAVASDGCRSADSREGSGTSTHDGETGSARWATDGTSDGDSFCGQQVVASSDWTDARTAFGGKCAWDGRDRSAQFWTPGGGAAGGSSATEGTCRNGAFADSGEDGVFLGREEQAWEECVYFYDFNASEYDWACERDSSEGLVHEERAFGARETGYVPLP
jgi:hypothetical protein